MNKCYGCLFISEYRDMGASTPLCSRCTDFNKAIKAVETTEPCKWHITKSDVKKLQCEGVIGQAPTDYVLMPEEIFKKISQSANTAADAVKALTEATQRFRADIEKGGTQ